MDRDAHSHSDIARVNPAGPEPRTHRLTVGDLPVRLRRLSSEQSGETGMEKSAEAVVVRRGKTPRDVSLATANEGPNRLMQEAVSETRRVGATLKDGSAGDARKANPGHAAPRGKDGKGVTRSVAFAEPQDPRRLTEARVLASQPRRQKSHKICGSATAGRAVQTSGETAGYDEYVRWCGRTGAARPPPTRLRHACDVFRRCKSSTGRNERNRPSKQGCPSRDGIRRKPMTGVQTRRTGTGYKASVMWVIGQ